jgi:hypothetical protein
MHNRLWNAHPGLAHGLLSFSACTFEVVSTVTFHQPPALPNRESFYFLRALAQRSDLKRTPYAMAAEIWRTR